jgi:hypothetical protein
MLKTRMFGLKQGLRAAAVALGLAFAPPASAGVHVAFGFNVVLPPGVYVSASNVEPYYVGSVYYGPAAVWRPVYSFPVQTAFGVVYQPYVYAGGHPVCRGYIPGPAYGYTSFSVAGHGHFDRSWYHGPYVADHHGHGGHGHGGHGHGNEDRQ